MEQTLTFNDLSDHLADYLRRVATLHERFIVMENEKPIAELRPIQSGPKLKDLPKIMAELPHLNKEDADAFARDIEKAREVLNAQPLRNPWES